LTVRRPPSSRAFFMGLPKNLWVASRSELGGGNQRPQFPAPQAPHPPSRPPSATLFRAAEQRLFRVLHRNGHERVEQLRLHPAATHGPDVAEVTAGVGFQRADLLLVRGGDELEPVQPQPPAVVQGVGYRDVKDAGPLPVPPPPGSRVQAVGQFRGPPLGQVRGSRVVDLAQEPGQGDAYRTARLDETRQVVQVQVVRTVVARRRASVMTKMYRAM
jgi:hypothetical protein